MLKKTGYVMALLLGFILMVWLAIYWCGRQVQLIHFRSLILIHFTYVLLIKNEPPLVTPDM